MLYRYGKARLVSDGAIGRLRPDWSRTGYCMGDFTYCCHLQWEA